MSSAGPVAASRPTALVTGASSGIGAAFARMLAARRYDVILVARRAQHLERLAAELRALPVPVRAEPVVADLTDPAQLRRAVDAVAALGMRVDLLVNNAGFGTRGRFEELPAERERDEVALNCSAVVELTHAFVPGMLARGGGAVLNVASTAAFRPVPYMAVYGATKAFVRSFSEALDAELRPRGVRVVCLCPGPTATEFFDVAKAGATGPIRSAAQAAKTGLTALAVGKRTVIDGPSNQLLIAAAALVPRHWAVAVAGRFMRPPARRRQ